MDVTKSLHPCYLKKLPNECILKCSQQVFSWTIWLIWICLALYIFRFHFTACLYGTILHISFHLNNKRCAGNVLVCCCTTSTVRPCCQSPVSFLVEYSHRDTLFVHVTVHVLHRLVASCTHGAHVAAVLHVGCWYAYTPASSALLENICRFSLFSLGHEPT